jgi:hypothetical protein
MPGPSREIDVRLRGSNDLEKQIRNDWTYGMYHFNGTHVDKKLFETYLSRRMHDLYDESDRTSFDEHDPKTKTPRTLSDENPNIYVLLNSLPIAAIEDASAKVEDDIGANLDRAKWPPAHRYLRSLVAFAKNDEYELAHHLAFLKAQSEGERVS